MNIVGKNSQKYLKTEFNNTFLEATHVINMNVGMFQDILISKNLTWYI